MSPPTSSRLRGRPGLRSRTSPANSASASDTVSELRSAAPAGGAAQTHRSPPAARVRAARATATARSATPLPAPPVTFQSESSGAGRGRLQAHPQRRPRRRQRGAQLRLGERRGASPRPAAAARPPTTPGFRRRPWRPAPEPAAARRSRPTAGAGRSARDAGRRRRAAAGGRRWRHPPRSAPRPRARRRQAGRPRPAPPAARRGRSGHWRRTMSATAEPAAATISSR